MLVGGIEKNGEKFDASPKTKFLSIHSRSHRQHSPDRTEVDRAGRLFENPGQGRIGEPDRQHERPDGVGHDRSRGTRRSPETRRSCRRIHSWKYRRVTGARLRGKGILPQHRHLRCVQYREAQSHGRVRSRPHDRAECGWRHGRGSHPTG